MKKLRIFLLGALAMIFTLACSMTSLLPGSGQMQATADALQATQIALDVQVALVEQQQTAVAQQPQATQAEAEAHAAPVEGNEIIFEGVRFVYPDAIASGVDPASKPEMEDMAGMIPAHTEFNFSGYAWDGSMHTPTVYVYSTDAYRSANEYAGETIDELNTLIHDRPAAPENIPFLPIWNAAQMFTADVKYIDFQNGSGVRFLSQYGQAIYPINNNGLFYTFQGLTNDGAWYISAVFPVSHAGLPGDDAIPGDDWETFSDNYLTYMAETINWLNTQPADSFTPHLNELDDLIHSMQVK
ncbi:MAG: hypothetical protein RBT34_02570 [Anaerolineaceae bacterium]|jgi:hypothetical protein|nr:hypothetical protein [Anaerolineaceae bacterium]